MFTVEDMLKQLEGLPLGIPIEVDNGKKTVDISYIKVNTFRDVPYRMVIMPETTETEIENTNNDVKDKIPAYYKSGSYDVFDIANRYGLDMPLGTAIKYIVRAGKKDKAKYKEDLEKAIQCINRELELIERWNNMYTNEQLKELLAMSLEEKIQLSKQRII